MCLRPGGCGGPCGHANHRRGRCRSIAHRGGEPAADRLDRSAQEEISSHNIASTAAAIGETSHSASDVLDAAKNLTLHANALRASVDRFLTNVAAA